MKLSSPAFENNAYMPAKYTCEGQGVNPPLIIKDIPAGTKSLALIADDPDAPGGMFVHWVVFDILPVSEIRENSVPGKQLINNSGSINYCSPCPPSGSHRYFFKIYALDAKLDLKEEAGKAGLEAAMQGHILDKDILVGLYKKRGSR